MSFPSSYTTSTLSLALQAWQLNVCGETLHSTLQLSIHTSGEKDLLGLEIQLPIYKNELWVYKHSNKFMDTNFVFINTNFAFINTGSNL